MMIARGLSLWFTRGLVVLCVQVWASNHARNAQDELARDEHDQRRQNPRPKVQTSSVALELADNPSHCPKF
jgi:hypothetical protein